MRHRATAPHGSYPNGTGPHGITPGAASGSASRRVSAESAAPGSAVQRPTRPGQQLAAAPIRPGVPAPAAAPPAPRRRRRRRESAASASASMLRHHGDEELADGLENLAVNIRSTTPPLWAQQALLGALQTLTSYPKPEAAHSAVAERHGVPLTHCLVTNGATEAFTLLARTFTPNDVGRVAIVHPQFSEPERASLAAGHRVVHVMCRPENGFALDPTAVPDDAGLVFIGNPTNPTGVLHSAQTILSLLRPGRVVVVDEAFMDAIPHEQQSLIPHQLPGLVVIRSLTKTWALPGLRVGYAVGDPDVIAGMAGQQPPWSVNSLALAATTVCMSDEAQRDTVKHAKAAQSDVSLLKSGLQIVAKEFSDVAMPGDSAAPFVTLFVADGERRRQTMRQMGWAIRSCASFPGLGPDWWRITAQEPGTTMRFVTDLKIGLASSVVSG